MTQKGPRTRAAAERAYSQLKEMILYHRIKPGQRLQDRDLAQELGVSRTPVREALGHLERDGLVTNRNGRGYFVREIDSKEVEHLYDLRELIECHAITLAVKHAKPEDIAELAGVLDTIKALDDSPKGRSEEITLGNRVHEIIGRASGNPFLHEMMVRALALSFWIHWTEAWLETPAEIEATRREHRACLSVLRAKSAKKARDLIRTHVRRGKAQVLRILRSRQAFYEQRGTPVGSGLGRAVSNRKGTSLPIPGHNVGSLD